MDRRGKDQPYELKTPPGTSDYQMYFDERDGKAVIVCVVGSTTLLYDARCIEDTVTMLQAHGDWMDLGGADEQKEAKPGTLEAWGRSEQNPVGGWYGLKKGLRGRFGVYVPPLLEAMGPGGADARRQEQPNPRQGGLKPTLAAPVTGVSVGFRSRETSCPRPSSRCRNRWRPPPRGAG